ncbi:hypothetical protein [Listeria seeligeri]|uniref:hypothetical protein n=1 Tax=Listeria seeligeri TaxID=1640 RepID=UPI0016275961|nr:hypothetical protein [Listeria seeligeri]MBC1722287.1 hypothetical protein [Listeria seeligeri]MBF2435814.1 hypothetical protein [Listeria seeligeri]HAC0715707.1 hypothetical protein [Listeria monocytogenes]
MTQKSIEEVKFEEAKKLVAEIQTIATFNENITCAVNISFNDGKGVHSASSAIGEKSELLKMYGDIAEAIVYEFMKDHDCICNVNETIEHAIEGAVNGFKKFKQEAKEKSDENN